MCHVVRGPRRTRRSDITEWGWGAGLALWLSGAAAVATAIAAGVMAVVAVVKGERSILLLGPLLFGAFWVMFRPR
ncbi:MAG: hypothetical protein HW413_2188 [Thermoleophilia bacterium]|nr:hypothetical protein [Thermoleophilia bacterium]